MSRHYARFVSAQLLSLCTVCIGHAQMLPSAQARSELNTTNNPVGVVKVELPTSSKSAFENEVSNLAGLQSHDAQLSHAPQPGAALPGSGATANSSWLQADVPLDADASDLIETNELDESEGDPDLGILRLYPQAELDPDLGILRLQAVEEEPPRRPVVYATARTSTIWSENALSSVNPTADGLVQAGVGLRAVPALGSRTFATLTANGNIVRYFNETDFNYDELELGASIFHRITRRAYIDVGWRNEQLFRESGDRFLSDHQLRASIGRRDQLGQLRVDTAYQFQRSFTDLESRDRLLNRLSVSARYPVRPDVDLGVFYQLSLIDFTNVDRNDRYQQVLGALSYRPSSATQISLFGGRRFGDSGSDFIDFDSALVGVSVNFNLPLF